MRTAALFALAVVAMFLVIGTDVIHEYGAPSYTLMDQYFTLHSQAETGNNNAVTSIVFDYRGYDTLGEATILFTAVISVAMLFSRRLGE